jgi:hypothetical protein
MGTGSVAVLSIARRCLFVGDTKGARTLVLVP